MNMKKQSKPTVVSSKTLLAARAFEHLSIDVQDELLALMRTMVSQNQSEIDQTACKTQPQPINV